jgi:chromosome segregation ATPase
MRLIEQRTRETEIAILRERQKRLGIEQQIEQMRREEELLEREDERLEREEEQMRREDEQLAKEDEQLEKEDEELAKEDEQIENEIEQLRRENARLKTLLACVDQLCFPPESSSSPQTSTEPDCGPSSP